MKSIRQASLLGLTAAVFAFAAGSAQATTYNWVGGTSSDWETAANWGTGGKPTSGVTGAHRLNLGSTSISATRPLIYTSAQGTTTFSGADRGLAIYRTSTMEIQGGTFTTAGTGTDAVGLSADTATLTISGGTYNANSGLVVGFNAKGIFNINSGAANITSLHMSTAGTGTWSGTANLNGGTLSVNNITAGTGANFTTTVLLNGGTLKARQNETAFISTDLKNLRVGANGANIDTAGFDVTIAKALTPDGASAGGLIKSGLGTLTLSGTNTYTGETEVTEGTLELSGSVAGDITVTGGELSVSGTVGGDLTVASGATLGGTGSIGGQLHFAAGGKLLFNPDTRENPTLALQARPPLMEGEFTVSFDGFSVAHIDGLDNTATLGTYRLMDGAVDFTNVSTASYDLGGGKSAYLESGSLNLVVIPEPATLSMIGMIGFAMILRRRIVRG